MPEPTVASVELNVIVAPGQPVSELIVAVPGSGSPAQGVRLIISNCMLGRVVVVVPEGGVEGSGFVLSE